MSSQANKNKTLYEDAVSETYLTTVRYNIFLLFESGAWDISDKLERVILKKEYRSTLLRN